MAFPNPIKGVARDRVHAVVKTMLMDKDVAHVSCREAKDGTYTVTPRPRKAP
ncbi:MAG: hypothetical protein L6Q95_13660 [Planctomycetes bacterium]|nr:hypothetical protein [Planctomycetota bacterium]